MGAAAAAAPAEQDLAAQALALARQGGEEALRQLATQAGARLPARLPRLWQAVSAPLAALPAAGAGEPGPEAAQAAVNALHLLAVLAPALHPDLLPSALEPLLPAAARCCAADSAALQVAAARCLAAAAGAHVQALTPPALRALLPLLAGDAPDASRLGGLLALTLLLRALGLEAVPYALLVVAPLMGRMSDPLPAARSLAARAFAGVVALLPLAQVRAPGYFSWGGAAGRGGAGVSERCSLAMAITAAAAGSPALSQGAAPPPGLDAAQAATLEREAAFLRQLLEAGSSPAGSGAAAAFELPAGVGLRGSLRRYQRQGVAWLAFLRRFGLHGVLADDMGLGKTLQVWAAARAGGRCAWRLHVLARVLAVVVCLCAYVGGWGGCQANSKQVLQRRMRAGPARPPPVPARPSAPAPAGYRHHRRSDGRRARGGSCRRRRPAAAPLAHRLPLHPRGTLAF